MLPTYPEDLSAKARTQLECLGVEVRVDTKVIGIEAEGVTTEQGSISARTVLWGAGVQGSPLAKTLGVPLDRSGRVLVEPDLTIPGAPEIFVIGDLAALEQDGKPVPGVAPAAMQGGKYAAQDNSRDPARQASQAVSIPRQRLARHDRAGRGRRPDRQAPSLGLYRLGGLVADPCLLPDQLPEPGPGYARMGMALPVSRPGLKVDHRAGRRSPGGALDDGPAPTRPGECRGLGPPAPAHCPRYRSPL